MPRTTAAGRALTYPVLLVLIGAAYAVGVVRIDALLGLSSDWLAAPQIVAVGLIALAVQPVQRRMRRWADRLVHGRRAPAYQVLAEVSAMSRDSGGTADSLRALARAVGAGMGVATVVVTVEAPDGTLTEHAWPVSGPAKTEGGADAPLYRIPVGYRGVRVGYLAVPAGTSRFLPAERRRLLADLVGAAGALLHNAGRTADLEQRLRKAEALSSQIRASRWRIVAAQDGERRALERDLHDEAQPGLTAVRLALGLLAHLAGGGDPAAARAVFERTRDQVDGALAGLRRTLDGLDPQVLSREGLVPALRERAAGLGCAARFETGAGVAGRRFAPTVEAAVYYCCSEALQNAAKHSPGADVTVTLDLESTDGSGEAAARLCFAVADAGPGFDPAQVRGEGGEGGLQNMADRISVAGGWLDILSAPGAGTRVSGWVPPYRVCFGNGLLVSKDGYGPLFDWPPLSSTTASQVG